MTRRHKPIFPPWWSWPRTVSDHIERRMLDRGFTHLQLHAMLAHARHIRPSTTDGRFVVDCSLRGRQWRVVLEPQPELQQVVIVTAFSPD
ncbi:MAG: hypothetical protein EXR77_19815 [Myxococcales bacterium]|nr:hypothetical protein [Myxococcales bacterium]